MEETKNKVAITIAQNAFVDKGDGVVEFPGGLVITDDTEQWNGTKYDIKSMDISAYSGKLTADHDDLIEKVVGKVSNVRKVFNKIKVGRIDFAVQQSALARLTYDLLVNKYITDFSIETIGPFPDENNTYRDAKLIGLSIVVTGNNKSAHINDADYNALVANSIEESKRNNIDVTDVEKEFICYNGGQETEVKILPDNSMKYVTIKNTRDFAIELTYKNASGEDIKTSLAPGASLDVAEDQAEALNAVLTNAVKPEKKVEVKDIVASELAPVLEQMKEMSKTMATFSAKEPEFKKTVNTVADGNEAYDYKKAHGVQINLAWNWLHNGAQEDRTKLYEMNQKHLERLQKKGIVENTMTLADMGNFVISPELLSDIEGFRSDFSGLLSKVTFKETLSLEMAWLNRSGDIAMSEVEMCDDGADGNLKPISEYTASIKTSRLHELAAVTPVCDAATRFLAADLLGDIAAGYRNDYDRKRAQLVIARLQQAVDETGNVVPYSKTTDVTSLKSFIDMWSYMAEEFPNGTFIFNYQTFGELMRGLVGAGINTDAGMGVFTRGENAMILGRPYILVPNELMPSLNSNPVVTAKTFVVEGVSVVINRAVFFADLTKFSGRTSGGLKYDLSTEAAYEVSGVVKSAFQRNELVLRGSFFRGGVMRDVDRVVAMGAAGVS